MEDKQLDQFQDPIQLSSFISNSKDLARKCDDNTDHSSKCFVDMKKDSSATNNCDDLSVLKALPQCDQALMQVIFQLTSRRPTLIDDNVQEELVNYFKYKQTSARNLISHDVLNLLYSANTSSLLTWLKYEAILVALIKNGIYKPETMSDELIRLTKIELNRNIASKVSSVVGSCVKYCREINKNNDREMEEKWCEIIEWMSWFLVDDQGDDLML